MRAFVVAVECSVLVGVCFWDTAPAGSSDDLFRVLRAFVVAVECAVLVGVCIGDATSALAGVGLRGIIRAAIKAVGGTVEVGVVTGRRIGHVDVDGPGIEASDISFESFEPVFDSHGPCSIGRAIGAGELIRERVVQFVWCVIA